MTTVLFTKDYLAGDRGVMFNGMIVDDRKIHVVKDRVAYFFGATHPTANERKILNDVVYSLMFGKEKRRAAAEAYIEKIIGNNVLFVMTRKMSLRIRMHWQSTTRIDPETLTPVGAALSIEKTELLCPLTFGTGCDLARAAHATGISPENAMQLLIRLDPMSGKGFDVVYRENLKP